MSATALRSVVAGAIAQAAPPPKDTPQGRNILLHPVGKPPPDPKPTMKEEALHYDKGGHDLPNKRERVYALLGPGATAYGVAAVIEPFVNYAPEKPVIRTEHIARAIIQYNADFIALPAAAAGKTWPAWRIGLRVPVPLEIKSETEWVVDRAAIDKLRTAFDESRKELLKVPASPLEIPDPKTLRDSNEVKVAANTLESRAEVLAKDLLVNPYEPVFRALELLRQIDKANELTFVLDVLERIDDRQAKGLGRTTCGAVVLRRLWRTLTTAQGLNNVDQATLKTARDRVAAALGLKVNTNKPGEFDSPTETWPTVTPLELPDPVTTGQSIKQAHVAPEVRAQEDPRGLQSMVLGRQLCVGNIAKTFQKGDKSTWLGPSYAGRIDPEKFATDHATEILGATPSAAFTAAHRIVRAIVENEGWLDAVRAADAGMISTGLQQWSAHSNKELPVLLARFKELAPDHYDAFFGIYGLDARLWAPKTTDPFAYANDMDESGTEAQRQAKIADANPDWTLDTPYGKHHPGYCSLWNLAAKPVARMSLTTFPPNASTDPRAKFFGATPKTADAKRVEVSQEWAARFRLVSLCSIPYRVNQFQVASYRIRRIIKELPGEFIDLDGAKYGLKKLADSQFSAAAVLDQHINAPWDYVHGRSQVGKDLADAIARTPGTPHDPGPPKKLRDEWLLRFRVNYLGDRFVYGKKHRDGTIISKHDAKGGLSATSGTFTTWEAQ